MEIFDDFMVRAILAGVGVALAAAPLGCFIVWRRMAYFGDATAHASILGIALALAFSISIIGGVLLVALIMAVIVSLLDRGQGSSSDTLLGVMAHSALAFGLVAAVTISPSQIDLVAYLFGDILAVRQTDLIIIWGGAVAIGVLLRARWAAMLTATLSSDLACAAGISPRREQLLLNLALAVTVAIAIKIVGALLIAAMLIIPPAAARNFASTPEKMVGITAAIGVISASGGVGLAYTLDTPAGPTIVCFAAVIFTAASLIAFTLRRL